MSNDLKLIIEIEHKDKVYKQPDCRIKLSAAGDIMMLVRNDKGKWEGVKGMITIKGLVLRKEYYTNKGRDKEVKEGEDTGNMWNEVAGVLRQARDTGRDEFWVVNTLDNKFHITRKGKELNK